MDTAADSRNNAAITIVPTGAALAADVVGVDLSQPLPPGVYAQIRKAWNDHLILRFRGQQLDDPAFLNFARLFGELDAAPIHAGKDVVNPDDLPQRFVISGHIHDYQELANVIYPGSPIQHAANESKEKTLYWLEVGEDATAVPFLAPGGVGCISVTANVAPRLCSQLQDAWHLGAYEDVFRVRDILTPLHEAMFLETNPAPVKFAASLLGKCAPDVRPPLSPLKVKTKARVEEAMRGAGLLNYDDEQ